MDADGTFDPKDIPILISPILNGNADIVFGTSFGAENANFVQLFANRLLAILSKLLFGIKTTSYMRSGLRAFNADKFKELMIGSYAASGFEFDLKMINFAKRKGYRICEIPLKTRLRMSVGYSQAKLISSLNLYRALLRAGMSSSWSENK
jgi:hypothetical protein